MSRSIFTPEELAELAAADAEIGDDEPLTLEEWRESMRRDRGLFGPPKPYSEERRAKQREKSKAYRAAHREYARQAHREWYAKNRAYAQAWQREYDRVHAKEKREAAKRFQDQHSRDPDAGTVRAIRLQLGMTQRQLGTALGKTGAVVHTWEAGKTRVPAWAKTALTALLEEEAGAGAPSSE